MDKALRHRVNAARVVVRHQVPFFRRQLGEVSSEWKADDTRVTFADFAISERITRELQTSFPEDTCLSEESGLVDEEVKLKNKYTWILDPVDGTNNYALGIPFCAISLALLKEGRPVYGFLYDGCRDEFLEGGPGTGVRVDGTRLVRKSRPFEPKSGILALHFPLPESTASALFPLLRTYRVRCLGSAALQLAYVATGNSTAPSTSVSRSGISPPPSPCLREPGVRTGSSAEILFLWKVSPSRVRSAASRREQRSSCKPSKIPSSEQSLVLASAGGPATMRLQ